MDRSSVDPSNPSDPQRSSDRAIPVDLITRLFKSCGINNALDGTEDDAVWDDEEEETEDADELIDNEFETDSESRGRRVAELSRALSLKQNGFFQSHPGFRTNKSDKVNDQRLSFVYSFAVIYLHTHFSKALILGKFGKVIFCYAKILGYKTHPEF